jgi:hypothetical protein
MALPIFSYHFRLLLSGFFCSFVYCLLFDVANIQTSLIYQLYYHINIIDIIIY